MKQVVLIFILIAVLLLSYIGFKNSDIQTTELEVLLSYSSSSSALSSKNALNSVDRNRETLTHPSDDTKTQALQNINRLLTCNKTNSCPEDNSDPRASEFLRRDGIVKEAQKLLAFSSDDDVSVMARTLLAYEDGYVQEIALELLATTEPNERNLDSMLATIEKSYDTKIVKQIMSQLQRYPIDNRFEVVFEKLLEHGSIYAANTVASELLPFIQESNIESYKALLQRLDSNTKKAKLLKSTLFEYEMQNSGG